MIDLNISPWINCLLFTIIIPFVIMITYSVRKGISITSPTTSILVKNILVCVFLIAICTTQIFLFTALGWTYGFPYDTNPKLGLFPYVIGVIIHTIALIQLGRNWRDNETTIDNGQIITTGLYSYVRHPIYLGFFLEGMGLIQISHWFFLGGIVLLFVPIYRLVLQEEENKLLKQYGTSYQQYQSQTPWRMIPFLY